MGKALYEDLVQGLTEAIAFEGGEGAAHTRTYSTEYASGLLNQIETAIFCCDYRLFLYFL